MDLVARHGARVVAHPDEVPQWRSLVVFDDIALTQTAEQMRLVVYCLFEQLQQDHLLYPENNWNSCPEQ